MRRSKQASRSESAGAIQTAAQTSVSVRGGGAVQGAGAKGVAVDLWACLRYAGLQSRGREWQQL